MKVFIALLAIIGSSYAQIEPFGTEFCRLFADGVNLRYPGSCTKYQTCKNGVGKVTECTGTKPNYDRAKGCVKSASSDTYCKDPCTAKSPFWVTDPKSCTGYYKCVSGTGTQQYCPDDLHFNQKQKACIYPDESDCEGYAFCDVAPNNVEFKNEENCQMYYMCVKNKLKEYYCDDGGYYDVQKGCVKKSETTCEEHPTPYRICGLPKKPFRDIFVNDDRTCSGYFYCHDRGDHVVDEQPSRGKCPEDRFFDYEEQACYPAAAVVCHYDRCDGRSRSKVISGTKGCQHYLICDGDKTVSEEKCPDGLYFDDQKMECTSTVITYAACS